MQVLILNYYTILAVVIKQLLGLTWFLVYSLKGRLVKFALGGGEWGEASDSWMYSQ